MPKKEEAREKQKRVVEKGREERGRGRDKGELGNPVHHCTHHPARGPPQSHQCTSNCARAQRSGLPVPRARAIPAFACKGRRTWGIKEAERAHRPGSGAGSAELGTW